MRLTRGTFSVHEAFMRGDTQYDALREEMNAMVFRIFGETMHTDARKPFLL